MKRIFFLLTALFIVSAFAVHPVRAQTATPPTGPMGQITGTVTDRNTGKVVAETLDVMLHVLDLNYADKDMIHGKSLADGTFLFADVPFNEDTQFAVMATFQGVTYFSDTAPADMNSLKLAFDVPVYETTKDLANVQVDQMHVLFDFSTDGLETKELYILSNSGDHTVKDVYDLGNNKFAALQFPLPKDASYVFFQPEDKDRFVKQTEAIVDTYPLLPGEQSAQMMVSYLVPYFGERVYTYTAPVNIARMNFVLPSTSNVSLTGPGLSAPEAMTLKDNQSYTVYSNNAGMKAGETLEVTPKGNPALPESQSNKTNNVLAGGAAFLGFAVIGAGIWWWRRSNESEEEEGILESEEPTFDELITQIAQLDESYEQRGLSEKEYLTHRKALMQKAKHLSTD